MAANSRDDRATVVPSGSADRDIAPSKGSGRSLALKLRYIYVRGCRVRLGRPKWVGRREGLRLIHPDPSSPYSGAVISAIRRSALGLLSLDMGPDMKSARTGIFPSGAKTHSDKIGDSLFEVQR